MSDEAASNALTDEAIQRLFNEAFAIEDELESMKGAYMAACKEKREALKDIKGSAKDAGIPKKVFAAVLQRRAAEKKIERIDSALEEQDEISIYERTLNVLGPFADTPLGQAAVDEAKAQDNKVVAFKKGAKKKGGEDALDSLTTAEKNIAALTGADGITQLVD